MEVIAKSKETEFGHIPPDWEVKTLRELQFDISDGNYSSKYPKASDFRLMGVPFIRANNIKNMTVVDDDLRFISQSQHQELQKGHLKADDILITTRGEIGQIAFVPQRHIDSNINAQIVRINVSKSDVDNKFFGYFCSSDFAKKQFELLQTGSALKQLPVGKLLDVKIILPKKKNEQMAIAEKFGDIADLIFALEKLIAKKRDIKQATMQQLLTGKTRLPGFSGKWKVVQLDKLTEVIDPHPSHRAPPAVGNGVYFLGIGDLDVDGNIVGANPRIVHESILKEHSGRYNLNDSLIGLGRVASIGKVIRLKDVGTPYAISPTLGVIRPQQVDPNYLFFALQSSEVSDQFLQVMSGSTRAAVGMIVLRKLKIYLPEDMSEQTAIGEVLNSFDSELKELMRKLSKLNLIKQGMMQELLTGRIRLV